MSASTTTLYDNELQPISNDTALNAYSDAISFSTGADALVLDALSLVLSDGTPADGGSITVALLSDASGAPGSPINVLGMIQDADLPTTDSPVPVAIATPVALAANSRYWIALTGSADSQAGWAFTLSQSGTGVAAESYSLGGQTYPNADGPMLAAVGASVACFAAGTRIRTTRGDVEVERLRVGDLAVLPCKGTTAPVRWIGTRRVDCRVHPRPHDVWPIRISAGAFGPLMPGRDLEVSPDHAIFFADETIAGGGMLVPARYLVNGATVVQHEVAVISYFHVELDRHEVLLSEGLTTESYLDTGNRASFSNGGSLTMARPSFARGVFAREGTVREATARDVWASRACAPLVLFGPRLAAARARLRALATLIGFATTLDPDLHLVADGERIDGRRADRSHRFTIPAGARSVRLVSRSWVPSEATDEVTDGRRLGVAVASISGDGAPLGVGLGKGWHGGEPGWTWTDGSANVATAGRREIEVTLALGGRYWVRDASFAAVRAGSWLGATPADALVPGTAAGTGATVPPGEWLVAVG